MLATGLEAAARPSGAAKGREGKQMTLELCKPFARTSFLLCASRDEDQPHAAVRHDQAHLLRKHPELSAVPEVADAEPLRRAGVAKPWQRVELERYGRTTANRMRRRSASAGATGWGNCGQLPVRCSLVHLRGGRGGARAGAAPVAPVENHHRHPPGATQPLGPGLRPDESAWLARTAKNRRLRGDVL